MGSLELHELHRLDGACILSAEGTIDKSTVDAFEQGLVVGIARSSWARAGIRAVAARRSSLSLRH
jgi:hypothetical protein